MHTVVVIGGYGNFGEIISSRLASAPGIRLIVAGRGADKARNFADSIGASGKEIDSNDPNLANTLRSLGAQVAINCAGPFQNADYRVARAAIDAGTHYIDIADGRRFVCDISSLDSAARKAGVAVISGASSVPALSSAVVDAHLHEFSRLDSIETGISASEKIPGTATVAGVLSYVGKGFDVLRDGKRSQVFGWQGLRRERFGVPAGNRWLGYCDVPDLELFPAYYEHVQTVTFLAGLGLSVSHLGTWLLSGLARVGLLSRPEKYAAQLGRLATSLQRFGDGTSAMYLRMSGLGSGGEKFTQRWELIAQNNEGVHIPCLAAVALCRKLVESDSIVPGARACVGLLSLDEYVAELGGLSISIRSERETNQGTRAMYK